MWLSRKRVFMFVFVLWVIAGNNVVYSCTPWSTDVWRCKIDQTGNANTKLCTKDGDSSYTLRIAATSGLDQLTLFIAWTHDTTRAFVERLVGNEFSGTAAGTAQAADESGARTRLVER
jgi:hypothetical protein